MDAIWTGSSSGVPVRVKGGGWTWRSTWNLSHHLRKQTRLVHSSLHIFFFLLCCRTWSDTDD